MKKVVILILILVLSLSFVGCSSLGRVKDKLDEAGYVQFDMQKEEPTDKEKSIMSIISREYKKYTNVLSDNKDVHYYAWAIVPKSINFVALANLDFVVIVEFSSLDKLEEEIVNNEGFKALVEGVVGVEDDLVGEAIRSGVIVDNCFVHAKGKNAKTLYQTLLEE